MTALVGIATGIGIAIVVAIAAGRFAPVGSGLEEASHRRRDVDGRFAPVSPGLEEAGCIDVRLRLTSYVSRLTSLCSAESATAY